MSTQPPFRRMRTVVKLSIAVIPFGFTMAAHADRIHQRQVHQQHRIGAGVRSGSLTPREFGHLESQQARIGTMKRAARANGSVSLREHARIQMAQNRASTQIAFKKHNLH